MKNLVLIFCFLLGFQNLKSQSYIPMIEDSMIIVNVLNTYSVKRFRKYKYIGDTIINSVSYFRCFSDTNLKDSSYLITPAMEYYGAIREMNKKVYFLKKDSLVERKIYDFSVNLNDTFKIYYTDLFNKSLNDTRYFDTIQYLLPRKTYHFEILNPINSTYLVCEGFGNIVFSSNEIEEDYPTRRDCNLRKNNSLLNIPKNYSSCYLNQIIPYISIKELNLQKQISIFPNPSKDKVSIVSEGEKVVSVSIVDVQGKIIQKIRINSLKKEIDISSLDKGIYLLRMETEKGTVVKKMVKEF